MHRVNRLPRVPVTAAFSVMFFFTGGTGVDAQGEEYAPTIDAADFTTEINNPLFPLAPGTRWVYERQTTPGTSNTRRLWSLRRPGRSWYAQDRDGNVWYFGEDTKELEGGKVVKTEGSWEAGKDGALPGIIMEADPQVGDRYRQEYYEGEAEDMAEVLSVDERTTVPHGSFEGVLETKDWTPLEPGIVEHKHYARGVGTIHEEKVEGETGHLDLLEMTEGSTQAEAAPPPGEDEDDDEGDEEDAADRPAEYAYAGVFASSSRSRTLAGSTRTPGPMVGARVTALM